MVNVYCLPLTQPDLKLVMLNTSIRVRNCFHKNEITFKHKTFDNTKTMLINTLCSTRTYTKHTFREPAASVISNKYRLYGTHRSLHSYMERMSAGVTRYGNVSVSKLRLITAALFQAGSPTFPLHQIHSCSRDHSTSLLTSTQSRK
jgi:hypothetical protein